MGIVRFHLTLCIMSVVLCARSLSSRSPSSSSSQGGSPLDSLDALDSLLTPPQSQEEEEVSSSSSPSPSSSQQQQTPPSSSSLDDSDPYSTTPPPPWVLPGPRAGPLPPPKLQNKSKQQQQQSNPNNSNNSTPSEIRKEIKKQPLDENFYPNVGEAIRTCCSPALTSTFSASGSLTRGASPYGGRCVRHRVCLVAGWHRTSPWTASRSTTSTARERCTSTSWKGATGTCHA